MSALVVVIIILAVLLVIFTLQNSVSVTIHLFFWEISNAPFVLVILGCLILGYLLATLYFYPKLWKARREYKKVLRANDDLHQHDLDHPKPETAAEVSDPEGIELDDDDSHNFFRD
ncbi:LapA family protein [Maribellus sp. CM-23]|uniref:LapA family protein n=1 Tax=Maribellus sp. CM-23 TaxID=2781026 RepID=UPI001F3DF2E8|nr:LapA family protein [Maribellus sp. CM-23]MCE4562725.1 LapA family protein [Maribellus sp. CM-23]